MCAAFTRNPDSIKTVLELVLRKFRRSEETRDEDTKESL
jgi:hypothetical protein